MDEKEKKIDNFWTWTLVITIILLFANGELGYQVNKKKHETLENKVEALQGKVEVLQYIADGLKLEDLENMRVLREKRKEMLNKLFEEDENNLNIEPKKL